jgi:osmotically-inducible protein OsmY
VTRANLLHGLASIVGETKTVESRDDGSIRKRIYTELKNQPSAPVNLIDIVVRDGTVHLWGVLLDERQREAIHVVLENTPGVKAIEDHLAWVEPLSGIAVPAPEDVQRQASGS